MSSAVHSWQALNKYRYLLVKSFRCVEENPQWVRGKKTVILTSHRNTQENSKGKQRKDGQWESLAVWTFIHSHSNHSVKIFISWRRTKWQNKHGVKSGRKASKEQNCTSKWCLFRSSQLCCQICYTSSTYSTDEISVISDPRCNNGKID